MKSELLKNNNEYIKEAILIATKFFLKYTGTIYLSHSKILKETDFAEKLKDEIYDHLKYKNILIDKICNMISFKYINDNELNIYFDNELLKSIKKVEIKSYKFV